MFGEWQVFLLCVRILGVLTATVFNAIVANRNMQPWATAAEQFVSTKTEEGQDDDLESDMQSEFVDSSVGGGVPLSNI